MCRVACGEQRALGGDEYGHVYGPTAFHHRVESRADVERAHATARHHEPRSLERTARARLRLLQHLDTVDDLRRAGYIYIDIY